LLTQEGKVWWASILLKFQGRIDYSFKDVHLLEEALTHSSYAYESGLPYCNERMEFLGDAVLEICVSKILYLGHLSYNEGQLTRARANVVCKSAMADWAIELGIPELIRLGKGLSRNRNIDPESSTMKSLCADCMEAVLGAAFLDGGYSSAFHIVDCHINSIADTLDSGAKFDPKSRLQTITQNLGLGQPSYVLKGVDGEDHMPLFEVIVKVGDDVIGKGFGPSRKAAEFQAASKGIRHFS